MAVISSARRLMEDDQRHTGQVIELRTWLRERLSAAGRGLDLVTGPLEAGAAPGRAVPYGARNAAAGQGSASADRAGTFPRPDRRSDEVIPAGTACIGGLTRS